jgi:hypothetical protein
LPAETQGEPGFDCVDGDHPQDADVVFLELGVDVLLVGGEGRKEGGGVRRKVGVLSVLARPLSQQNKQAPSDQRLSQPSKPFFPTPSN